MKTTIDIIICLFIISTSLLVGMLNVMDGGVGIITIGCVACVIGGSFILGELMFKGAK
jgi:1,4-dihydroxy-2-naphthoate octaprenyltransferase